MIRLTRKQVRAVDAIAISKYGLPGIVLMENAARAVAHAANEMLAGAGRTVLIVCGGGNNGGDGYAAARHLHNLGQRVALLPVKSPDELTGDALTNWRVASAMGIPKLPARVQTLDADVDLIIDAVFGTGLNAAPRDFAAEMIERISTNGAPVLAVDLPSGLDCDAGQPLGRACVRAAQTVTFVAEKIGFANPTSHDYTGEIVVADIGCPREIIEQVLADESLRA
ncbi:MAG: NAD(P)H-hydrate epimerase [Tepidisphaeraceae bacterium]